MTDENFRVAVLGCGQVSQEHFIGWSHCPGVTLVAVCDPMHERAAAKSMAFTIPGVYTEPEAMFAAEKFDLVDIITPRATHADMVRLAARHGVHALCEKPLCPTYCEAQALIEEVGGRIRLMVNENWRYRDYFRKVGQWIAEGRLGKLVHARIALLRANLLRREDGAVPALLRQPFMATEERLLIAESLIHELDVLRSLFGDMDVIAARIARGSDAVIGEDAAAILLETRDGLSVIAEGVLSAAGRHIRAPDRLEISGTRCSVVLDDGVLRLFGAEEEELVYDENAIRQACFDASIRHFVEQMRSGEPFWTSARDQLETLRLVEDAYQSAGAIRVRV